MNGQFKIDFFVFILTNAGGFAIMALLKKYDKFSLRGYLYGYIQKYKY